MNQTFTVGAQSFYFQQFLDEGIEQAFQNLKEYGGINTLLLSTHIDFQSTKAWGPLTHAKSKYFNCEGFNCEVDLDFYQETIIKPIKTKIGELYTRELFHEITEAGNKSGINIYALILHRLPKVKRYPELHMRAVNGEMIPETLCHNQPEVRQFYKCLIDHLD